MPNLSDAKEIRLGQTPVREVYLGNKLVWPAKLLHWAFDFETPGDHKISVPKGAKYMYYWLSGAGAAGQNGDGGVNRNGLGGTAGDVLFGSLPVSVTTVKISIGRGGQPNNQPGGSSSFTLGEYGDPGFLMKSTSMPTNTLHSSRDGGSLGYGPSEPMTVLLNKVPGMIEGGKIQVIGGGLYNGPGGRDGGSGVRGGGGSGGQGGIFGRYKPGGLGGNGFCRLVFTNKQVE